MESVRPASDSNGPVRVGVIGESGVGKSTLVNALLSERLPLLPQGGIGPLTAIPIVVCYARAPYVKVRCLGAERIRELVAACGSAVRDEGARRADVVGQAQMALLLATGSQFGRLSSAELMAFLAACLVDGGSARLPLALRAQATRARGVVRRGDSEQPMLRIEAGMDLPRFLTTLAEHGAGFLAPLTASIELGWDAPALSNGLTLVDLPGLGVANDMYRLETLSQTGPLDAILLVVDRSGLSEASADLLRRALHSTQPCPAGLVGRLAPTLIVAVTKLDLSAEDVGWAEQGVDGGRTRWVDAYSGIARRAQVLIRSQLQLEFSRARSGQGRCASEQVEIFPVAPRDYQRLHRRDPEEPSRFSDTLATGIPGLVRCLSDLAGAEQTFRVG